MYLNTLDFTDIDLERLKQVATCPSASPVVSIASVASAVLSPRAAKAVALSVNVSLSPRISMEPCLTPISEEH